MAMSAPTTRPCWRARCEAKGARVLGFGGPGDIEVPLAAPALAGLAALPALQLIGERVAGARGLDTVQPRHLTKVVMLAS